MNIRTLVAWAVAAVLVLPAVASAQVNSLPSQPHLLVKGEAQREVIPDRFNIKLTLEAVDVAPEVARARVQEDATSVLSAFKQHHALSNSVQASTLSISPERRYENDRQVFKGTKVHLSADFSALDDVRGSSQSLQVSALQQGSGGARRTQAPGSRADARLGARTGTRLRSSARRAVHDFHGRPQLRLRNSGRHLARRAKPGW
ncbi:SIMPL domain-containing protein [Pantoea ananatis]|nr:SIMPL domain-containing protein [Pantoea ananatis]